MKNIIKFLAILLISFTFNSCDEVEKLADVDFSTTLVEKIPVHFDEDTTQESIDLSIDMSLDNVDTHDYLDKIKNLSIKKLTYKIVDLTGGDESSYMQVNLLMDAFELQHNLAMNIQEDFNNETIFEITDVNLLNQIANSIKTNKQISVSLSGDYQSQTITDFKIEVTLDLDVIANPL